MKEIKILAIGNSYTEDAFSYVPILLKEIAPEIDLTFAMAVYPGCTLEQQYDFITNNAPNYWYLISRNGENWKDTENTPVEVPLFAEKWDIITLQQQSERSQRYSTYQPYLNNLIDYLFQKINYPVKLIWHLTPSYGNTEQKGLIMSEGIRNATKQVLKDTPAEDCIPNGTAIQNARTTCLDEVGSQKHLSYDNVHMCDGIPKFIEAYTTVLKILEWTSTPKSIFGHKPKDPKTYWKFAENIVNTTPHNLLIGQKCAIAAIKNPFEITQI